MEANGAATHSNSNDTSAIANERDGAEAAETEAQVETTAAASTTSHNRQPSFDMESLLRQWGGSSIETTDIIDESNSVPAAALPPRPSSSSPPIIEGGEIPHPFLGRSHSTTPSNEASSTTTAIIQNNHRRISSTGGDRILTISPSHPHIDNNNQSPNIITPAGEELHAAARITDWTSVHILSTTLHPSKSKHLAKYKGPDGWTALHHACSRRCPHVHVIEALLRCYPEALVQVDDRGWTPLHHAARFKAPREVVRLLLRAYPELGERCARVRCCGGRSALYYAMRYEAPSGVVELLLGSDPYAVLDEDKDGVCPLSLVWDGYANSFGGKRDLKALLRKFEGTTDHQYYEGGGGVVGGANDVMQEMRGEELAVAEKRAREAMVKDTPALRQLQSKWRVVNNLLRAYFHFPIQTLDTVVEDDNLQSIVDQNGKHKRKWRILHAVSAIKCHHTLFLLARALHPEQAIEIDQNDLLGVGHDRHNKPQSPDEQIISNRNALHFAALSPISGKDGRNVIKTLLSLNPDAPRQSDGYGSLPLHLMAENEHKVHWVHDGFRDVYDAYREASSCRDGLGRTPLHCATACSSRYSTAAAPQHGSQEEGPTPAQAGQPLPPNAPPPRDFNLAARNAASIILNLVLVNRAAASIADNTGRLPLHYIAEHGEEWSNDAQSILAAHPAAARSRAGAVAYNQLPLHMAASNPDAHPSLIMNIVNANPRAASLTDGTGRLPLHMACDSGRTTWDRGIESIYNAYHTAISLTEESPRAWTVLHTAAASHSAGNDLIENVLKLNPGAASLADGEGRYPLHLACATGRHWEEGGLRILFEADPSAASMEDKHGYLPLHIVAMKKPSCLSDNTSRDGAMGEDFNASEELEVNEEEDLALIEVLFNLLIAQPDTVQLR